MLERAGLISRSRAAQSRPCRLEPVRFDTAAEWIGRHRKVWEDRYDRLDEHLSVLAAGQEKQQVREKQPSGEKPPDTQVADRRQAANQGEEAR